MKERTVSHFSFLSLLFSLGAFSAQANTPSEMADLSLQELFALSTDEMELKTYDTWTTNFLYKHSKVEGYLDGSTKLSKSDVLFDGVEPRTLDNYPVLPTVITQETYIINASYYFDAEQSVSLSIPYIFQSTDHESIVPGYDEFNISSEGVGDITVNYSNVLARWQRSKLSVQVGVSLPLGSIDEQGDTPRASGDQQLPYTMQLGSGTWDFPIGFNYSKDEDGFSWGANVFGKIRIGKNDRDYRLGNRFALSGWSKWYVNETFQPLIKVIYQDWGHIVGRDDEITVPNLRFPYPAGITNPQNYGGQKINLVVGSDIYIGKQVFTVELGAPIFQHLNGVQPKEYLHFSFNWHSRL